MEAMDPNHYLEEEAADDKHGEPDPAQAESAPDLVPQAAQSPVDRLS